MPPFLPSLRNSKSRKPRSRGLGSWPEGWVSVPAVVCVEASARPTKHLMHWPAGAPEGISAPQVGHVRGSDISRLQRNGREKMTNLLAHLLFCRVRQRVADLLAQPRSELILSQTAQG